MTDSPTNDRQVNDHRGNDRQFGERSAPRNDLSRAVRVTTGARLHFGLLDTEAPFGGVGLMIDRPETEIEVTRSNQFQCDAVSSNRLQPIAQRISQLAGLDELPKCKLVIQQRAESHCGLGSGTQLGLAAAEAISHAIGLNIEPTELATELATRGKRSAVGVHGYFCGGLIFERGNEDCELNPIQNRAELPMDWRVAIFRPGSHVVQVSGDIEKDQFANLSAVGQSDRDQLVDLAGEILQAAVRNDFVAFAESVQRYNHRSGLLFESVQNGPYNGYEVTQLIELLCDQGAIGVGQSSWGPGVFAWFDSAASAKEFTESLPATIDTIVIAKPTNVGRRLEIISH